MLGPEKSCWFWKLHTSVYYFYYVAQGPTHSRYSNIWIKSKGNMLSRTLCSHVDHCTSNLWAGPCDTVNRFLKFVFYFALNNRYLLSHKSGRLEVWGQDMGRVACFLGFSPWFVGVHLLSVSLHGFVSFCFVLFYNFLCPDLLFLWHQSYWT